MEQRVSATDARWRLGELVALAADGGPVVIEQWGEPFAALVPIQWYRAWLADRDAKFARFQASVANRPHYPEDEVEADIARAIAAVRAGPQPDGEGRQGRPG